MIVILISTVLLIVLVGLVASVVPAARQKEALRVAQLRYVFSDYLTSSCDRCRPSRRKKPKLRIVK